MTKYSRNQVTLMPAVALLALGALVAVPTLSSSRLYAAGAQQFATVKVHNGENLWSIASRYTNADTSVQDTVDAIVAANHLDGNATIAPGDTLRVPR